MPHSAAVHRVVADRLDVERDRAAIEGARDPGVELRDVLQRPRSAARSILHLRAASSRAAASVCGVSCTAGSAAPVRGFGVMPPPVSGRPGDAEADGDGGRRGRALALRRGRRRLDRAGIDAGELRDAPRQRRKIPSP